ncbi:MarP family serine protease [Auritidibacter ignavus]|uniref:MarP family serine protease n=1 Tax=Auritidibacter ignavus TaxID=678932 RepID=A0AAJ6AGL6_9MICC|nr:MarP family serine protease [Auritidibacter ignavus]WGH93018.1 MarP family serine protease [Auritidibacter ignavus]
MFLTWLDWVLLVVLVIVFINGIRQGLWVSAGRMLGFVLGTIAAFFLMPEVNRFVDSPMWRIVAMVVCAVVLVGIGMAIGVAVGRAVRLRVNAPIARRVDKVLGGIVNTAIASVLIALLAFSLSSMGMPQLTQTIKESRVIAFVTKLTPESGRTFVASLWTDFLDSGVIPELGPMLQSQGPVEDNAVRPPNDAVQQAGQATVRITGTAFECGQNQTGSGFAVEPQRVVTNAHVVAGVEGPTVEDLDGNVYRASVVYFDPETDLAILQIPDADLPTLEIGRGLNIDDDAYALGFPAGGPYRITTGKVQAEGPATLNNIYGQNPHLTSIYQLASDIREGNSGGPLVDDTGQVAGVIFAKAPDAQVGYAITAEEAGSVLISAQSYTEPVSTGQCLAD